MSKGFAMRRLLCGALLLAATGNTQAAQIGEAIADEIVVNTTRGGTQRYPDIGRDLAGNSFVIWQGGLDPDGNGFVDLYGVYGQRYDAAGRALGGEFPISSLGTNIGFYPAVAVNAGGQAIVVWQVQFGGNGLTSFIQGRRYDAVGKAIGGTFVIDRNENGSAQALHPDVTIDAQGGFVVSWQREFLDADQNPEGPSKTYLRRYNAEGVALGAAYAVDGNSDQEVPTIAGNGSGEFVVTWQDDRDSGSDFIPDIYARRFDATGAPRGASFRVNGDIHGFDLTPRVAMDPAGRFIITWRGPQDAGTNQPSGILARRYAADGTAQGAQFEVSSAGSRATFANREFYPAVTTAPDGDFAIGWADADFSLFARYYDAAGEARTGEITVSNDGLSPAIAMDASGDFDIVSARWNDSLSDIYLRRHAGSADVDLGVSISDDPDPVAPGSPVQYSVYVSNRVAAPDVNDAAAVSRGIAHDVHAQLRFDGAAFISAAGAGWTCSGTVTITCKLDGLLAQQEMAPLLTVAVQGAPEATEVRAHVTVGDAHVDSNDGNNTVTEITAIAGDTGPGPDTVPDGYSFIDAGNVLRETAVASNAVTITGINQAAPISIEGGEYQIGDGAWTAAAGTVVNGQAVRVRHTSSTEFSSEALTALDVGGIVAVFRSITLARVITPQAFSFATQSGVEPNAALVSNPVAITGINDAAPVSVSGGDYAVNGGAFTSEPGSANNGDTIELRVTSGPFGESRSATLIVGGTSASFSVISRDEPAAPPLVVENGGGAFGAGALLMLLAMFGWRRARLARGGTIVRRLAAALALTCGFGAGSAAAAVQPGDAIGTSARVNATTEGNQDYPDVGRNLAGAGTVVWQSQGQGILFQRHDAAGQPIGGESQVSVTGSMPAVAVDAAGGFVVVYQYAISGYKTIYGRRYDADGQPLGGSFTIAQTSAANIELAYADIAMDANGGFVVSWQRSEDLADDLVQAYARRYTAEGIARGDAFPVADAVHQFLPAIASDAQGNFVVVWIDDQEDGDGNGSANDTGIYARRFDSEGAARGAPFRVPTRTLGTQTQPAVAMDGDGDFVVVWRGHRDTDGNGSPDTLDVSAQRYDASGAAQGDEFEVSSADSRNIYSNYEFYPAVGMAPDGSFAVAWSNTDHLMLLRGYDAAGQPLHDEVRVAANGAAPAVALDAAGDVDVVYTPFGGESDVFLSRHSGVAEVDLGAALSDSPDPVSPGSPLQYSLYVTNLTASSGGPEAEEARALAHNLHAQFSFTDAAFISAAGAGWSCDGDIVVDCRYDKSVPRGATAPLLTLAVQGLPTATQIEAQVTVNDAHVDGNAANNTVTERTSIAGDDGGPGPDTVPDGYSFIDAGNVARDTLVASNAVTITGINQPAPVSVGGGEYRIGDGAWTAAAGSVSNGQIVRVRHTSAAEFSTETLTTLEIGGIAAAFRSVTLAQLTTPQAFSFATQSGVEPAAAFVSNPVTIAGINDAATISVSGGDYAVNGGAFTSEPGSVNNGDTVEVRVTSGPFGESRSATLVVGGTSASFTVIARAAPEEPDAPPLVVENGGGAFGAGGLLMLLAMFGWRRRTQ